MPYFWKLMLTLDERHGGGIAVYAKQNWHYLYHPQGGPPPAEWDKRRDQILSQRKAARLSGNHPAHDNSFPSIHVPWKPCGTRAGNLTRATGAAVKSRASTITISLLPLAASWM